MMKRDVIRFYGGAAKVARVLNITRQAVYQWGKYVPKGVAYQLQALTEGKLRVMATKYKKRTRRTSRKTNAEGSGEAQGPGGAVS